MGKQTFYQQFLERLNAIEKRAQAVGITITHVCRDAGIGRSTPDRWRHKAPKSIQILDDMEKAVEAAEQKAAAGQ